MNAEWNAVDEDKSSFRDEVDEDDDTGAEKAEFEPMAFVWIGLAILLVLTVFFYFWKGRKGEHARSRILNQQQGIEIELGEVTPRTIPVRASRMIHGDRTIPVAPAANARIDCGAGHAEVISIEPIPSPLYLPGGTHVSSHSGMTEGERPIDLALPSAKAVVAAACCCGDSYRRRSRAPLRPIVHLSEPLV